MSSREIELKSMHRAGCHRTVDLGYVGDAEARGPVCGRAYLVAPPDSPSDLAPVDPGSARRAA